MEQLTVAGSTEVLIGRGLPGEMLPSSEKRSKVVVITQEPVVEIASNVAQRIGATGIDVTTLTIPNGEEAKTLDGAQRVYGELAAFGMNRHDTVVGVGGGSVTDFAGFIAATWLRGVESVYFPTTLLGAVDAAIGGKTGVNLGGKNLVGAIWHPSRVAVDLEVLEQLPSSLKQEGMAEAYKAGLVGDPILAAAIDDAGLASPMEDLVVRAIAVKANIVDQDERESGIRAYLNFGHTIGHAVEFASSYSHGSSVSIGMVAAAEVSELLAQFGDKDRVRATLELLGLPTSAPGVDRARVVDLLRLDKKADSSGLRMVLLEGVGQPVLRPVTSTEVEVGLEAVGL